MSEMEKGMISEEALDQVAGGLNIDREKLKKGLKIAGVVVGGVAAAGGLGTAGVMGIKKLHDKKKAEDPKAWEIQDENSSKYDMDY